MHSILKRQLARYVEGEVPEEMQEFLQAVDHAYEGFDRDRLMLERSMEISSKELLAANTEMRAVFTASPDLLLWTDRSGVIVSAQTGNPEDLFLPIHELMGKNLAKMPIPGVGESFQEAMQRVEETGSLVSFDYEVPSADSTACYEARLMPILNGQVLAIIRNVSERRQLEEARAESLAKNEFLANVSHELRTPLHGILSFTRLAEKPSNADKIPRYLEMIGECGRSLLSLVDDLLDISKLTAGRLTFDMQVVDLEGSVSMVVDQFRSQLSGKGVRIDYTPSTGPFLASLDRARIQQVIRNLLGNAVKFSPADSVIEIEIGREGETQVVAIRDQGTGIPEDELTSIFEQFTQSSWTSTGAGGSGLGLSICRRIVEAHHGRIWAENSTEGGSVFRFTLPAVADEPAAALPTDPASTEESHPERTES